ncbi:MAG TPA: hypothetical protein VKR23_15905 [Gaiellaceae bacterium]|nr:hypothetical protein [Gaiellaceae bacterium]
MNGELPTLKIIPELVLRDVELFSSERIADILDRCEALGFSLEAGSPLDDLTLRELAILTDETRGAN